MKWNIHSIREENDDDDDDRSHLKVNSERSSSSQNGCVSTSTEYFYDQVDRLSDVNDSTSIECGGR